MSHSFLFELLLEEIPAWMLPERLRALEQRLAAMLRELTGTDPAPRSIRVGATSRRIWFTLTDLPAGQPDRDEEIKGPSARAAYAADGSPTRALEGFLRKNQASASDLTVRDDYVRLRRQVAGRRIERLLAEEIPAIVEGLHWPKSMRWGRGERAYIRPAHSLVALFDGAVLPMQVLGISAGSSTSGHRILANRKIEVSGPEDYATRLAKARVVVDPEERVERLRALAAELAAEVGGTPAEDEGIWHQWQYLTEWPGLVRSEFDEAFLSIPFEVLVTVMRVHQKQLPIWREGSLTNSFLSVMDQTDDRDGNVAGGNSFVTNARFADARFFHETDRKRPLEDRVPELRRLQFQEKLGNYYDKTERMAAIAAAIRDELGEGDAGAVERAARLAKADLVTEMVKEFTELQGRIGGIYAREEGMPDEIWQAIYDQYLPVNVEGALPRTLGGAIVSIADKLDTLAGLFRIGLRPTGSKDPFALRRAAQGVVQILLNRDPWRLEVPVERLLDIALSAHGIDPVSARATADDLREFLAERVRTLMEHPRYGGYGYDEIAATMESGWAGSLPDLQDRLAAIRDARRSPEFLSILDSARRIRNIAGEESSTAVDPALLEHPAEKRLAEVSALVAEQIGGLVAEGRYHAALESFAGMTAELDTFFDEVLVMVDDEAIRRNRIALLNRVGLAARQIADVTRIVVDRRDYNAR
ncbi:MAG TPA: glycine--tRNA ligase subunit beta [Thermoanaerobaculia bacterium]|nr:glycine--tRNA ligase subunit beta [Thermoanaerobaculia bacterium]